MNILIIGGSGLVGSTLSKYLEPNNEIHLTTNTRDVSDTYNKTKIDLLHDYKKLEKLIDDFKPNVIVNTAAYPNVDFCETHKKESDYLHVEIVKKLIEKCCKTNSKQIYLSSDAVFDGNSNSKYIESDLTNPLSHYGKTKLNAEKILLESSSSNTVLRTTVIYGWHERSRFTNWVLKKLRNNEQVPGFIDQRNTPTLVDDLALAIKRIIEDDISGLYHAVGKSCLSRYDFALLLAEKFELSKELVIPVISKNMQEAPRPINGCLDCENLENIINFKFSSIQTGVNFMLDQRKDSNEFFL